MTQTFMATYEHGVLRPDAPIELAAGERVRVILDSLPTPVAARNEALDELDRLCEEAPIHSGGEKLTRDQMHERD